MGDLISRQAAIKAIEDLQDCYNGFSDTYDKACIIGVLEELPSIDEVPRWIPCRERLPKPFEYCLFTTTDGEVVYRHWDGMASRYKAWMPLPKPARLENSQWEK